MDIRVIFGSTTGNTEHVAELIKRELGTQVKRCESVTAVDADEFGKADLLILGSSTWENGQLQDDWEEFLPTLESIDLSGKKVALFGLGDGRGFPTEFVNALRLLYDRVRERGAEVIGHWPAAGYYFKSSLALEGDKFVGLVIDEDNESEKTEIRVKSWVEQLKAEAQL